MNFDPILHAMYLVGGVGLAIGLFLGVAGIIFLVKVDEREEEVLEALPGNNCGACGFPGCAGLATAIAKGEAPVNACPVGGEACAIRIAEIMGTTAEKLERKVAYVQCAGTCEKTTERFDYYGVQECNMANMVTGGSKSCSYGCLGYGSCLDACEFDAINMVDGIAVIDKEACKACGKCVGACPRNIIEMIPYAAVQKVACVSKDKGPVVRKNCEVGCIACKICEKNCPVNAITVNDLCAHIDYSICTNCGICVSKCPRDIIIES